MRLLDEYIIGNAAAKKAVAVSFAQYMTRKRTGDINIPHDHILLFGPEGVGKGYMLKLLAQKAKLPYQHIVWGAGADSNENFGTLGKTFSIGTTPYGLLIIEGIDRGGIPPQGEIGRILASSSDVYFTLRGDGGFINSGNLLWAFILSQGQETNGSSNREITRKENVLSNDDRSDAAVPTRNPFSASLITPLLTQIPIQMEMQALDSSEKARALFTKGSPLALYREALRWRGYSLTLKENAARDLALTAPRSEGGVSGVMERCHALLSEVLMDPAKYANARREITIDVELVREILPSSQYLRGNMK